uniref:Ig-like domain-containing protein n=1 Tax=Zosterops lateralis melanops TaxID=1220523 RepID=A0A8D2P833_ZOSLA
MPCPLPTAPSPVLALAGWCPLSPTGAQTTQLLVEPPWRPAVLWDRVTLTCQGLGSARATTWYKDGQLWWAEGPDKFTVTESGTYQCDRPGSGLSPTVTVSHGEGDWLVLQVPAWPLLEGDMVTLRCRDWGDRSVTQVQFYCGDKEVSRSLPGTELSLSPLVPHCPLLLSLPTEISIPWVSVWAQPPGGQVAPGDRLVLSCEVATGTCPLSFTWHQGGSGAPLGTSPHLELRHIGDNDSGHYHCWVSNEDSVAESVPLNVTVLGG